VSIYEFAFLLTAGVVIVGWFMLPYDNDDDYEEKS
jgi:hypothetical protein